MNLKKAVSAIEKKGALLVFPINNAKEPPSLWSEFFPKSKMRWEWDDKGDTRVADLWRLREELSRSGKVVYSKWYRNRATFFSKTVFTSLMATLGTNDYRRNRLTNRQPKEILEILEMDSPLSTKQLKEAAGLRGKDFEKEYEKALKELWHPLLIVGYGEIDDGAFPSLAMGSTQVLFEELWEGAGEMNSEEGLLVAQEKIICPLFLKWGKKLANSFAGEK